MWCSSMKFLPTCGHFNSGTFETFLLGSPDLAFSDVHFFPALKKDLGGHRFQSDKGVKIVVTQQLYVWYTALYKMGIDKLALH